MTFVDILYTIFIGPLQLVFEIIYTVSNRLIGHPGLAIIILSLVMNFLVLPLYKRSDAMQEAARDVEEKLREGVDHIKKTFTGDEQMMILQTYYRQNNYKPTDALNGSVSLLLQVPFFMAAYNFLSELGTIQGVSLGPIADLSAQDALLSIGGVSINLLPIIMTLVNVISSAIYLKGFPLKTKIQIYGMALFFLVFLYTSPSGLVFYWTLNNLFSLVKTIFYKLKNSKKVEAFVHSLEKDKPNLSKTKVVLKNDTKLFVLGVMFLTVLVGLLIPSTLIAASPQEFVDVTYFYNPLWYLANTLCLAAGTFLVWMGVFYWLASPTGKAIFDRLVWIMCGIMLVNYMFFGTDLGIISANLQYETGMSFDVQEKLGNLLILAAVAAVMYFIIQKWQHTLAGVLLTAVIALVGMSGLNVVTIHASISELESRVEAGEEVAPHFNLSKNGKNVIVMVLDRALGAQIPYIFNEKPELKEQFAGFTYYSNTISYGGFTNFGTPPLYGGYEYTPVEMNKRDDELLMDKHNEALKVMPVLFSENGYDVTVCDAPYANYQWVPDLSIYDEYEDINTYITEGRFGDEASKQYRISKNQRNFFCFSVMKTMPVALQGVIYNNGAYNKADMKSEAGTYSTQTIHSSTVADGLSSEFMEAYNVLENLSNMTVTTEDDSNTFLMFYNSTVHHPTLLQEPEYVPAEHVDNTQYYTEENMNRFVLDDVTLKMEDSFQITHYQTNMAALLQVGEWLDYLRAEGLYDNTRIIIVSDHANHLHQLDELILLDGSDKMFNAEFYFPLLMVKDFDSTEFQTSEEFMTNADVPTMAFDALIENPTNPFTGNPINSEEKNAHEQYILLSTLWDVNKNNGTTFAPGTWWAVKDNIWDKDNWTYIGEETIMPMEE